MTDFFSQNPGSNIQAWPTPKMFEGRPRRDPVPSGVAEWDVDNNAPTVDIDSGSQITPLEQP